MKFVCAQHYPCNPLPSGTPEVFELALENARENPCLCSSPCIENKAAEFIRFTYLKRFIEWNFHVFFEEISIECNHFYFQRHESI